MEHDWWSVLQTQVLEAQHCHRHGWYLPHLHPHRHEICPTRGPLCLSQNSHFILIVLLCKI
ncbi:hypothetical protein ACSBR2_040793 [Camellia fascicularis]